MLVHELLTTRAKNLLLTSSAIKSMPNAADLPMGILTRQELAALCIFGHAVPSRLRMTPVCSEQVSLAML